MDVKKNILLTPKDTMKFVVPNWVVALATVGPFKIPRQLQPFSPIERRLEQLAIEAGGWLPHQGEAFPSLLPYYPWIKAKSIIYI